MLCSVIVPLYNKAPFVEEAIASVLAQRHEDFEIIVIDDGSSDEGPDLVRAMRDPRIRIEAQKNAGVSCARNRGIACANGELVCFLDADDWYHPDYLHVIAGMARRFPAISTFATGYRRVRSQSDMAFSPMADDAHVECIGDCFEHRRNFGAVFCTNSVAVRRSLLNALQPCFPVGESMGEDLDLWFRLGECSPLAFCPAQLAAYRLGLQESLTATHVVRELLPSWSRLETRALSLHMPEPLRSSALRLVAHERIMLARAAIAEGRRADGLRLLLRAWRGIGLRNWWVTAALGAGSPASVMRAWSRWREEKASEVRPENGSR